MYEYIEFIICYGEGITPAQVKEKTREERILYTRQLIMYFCRLFKVGSLSQVGSHFDGENGQLKDHATVIHACKVIENYIDTDKIKRAKIEYYCKIINQVISLSKKGEDIKKIIEPIEKQISELEARCINLTLQLAFIKTDINEKYKQFDTDKV